MVKKNSLWIVILVLLALCGTSAYASDPNQALQWYLEDVGQPAAQAKGLDGTGVTVAIIDSGCRLTHEDLQGMHLTEARDFLEGGSTVTDEAKHGTGVTGILAAGADNGVGMTGLAPEADYLILRACSKSGGEEAALENALRYAIQAGADVINLSVGNSQVSRGERLQPILDLANRKGIIVVAAVGNSGTETVLYPAGCHGVIGVGSYDKTGERSDSSNRNRSLDILAPGVGIYTLSPARDNTYTTLSGSSFAAPMVSAMAAWAKQVDPCIDGEDFLALLRQTATDAGTPGYDTEYGWGYTNGQSFVEALLNREPTAPLPFSDVTQSDDYYAGMAWAYRVGLMNGTGENRFSPRGTLTRAMADTMLYRAMGSPAAEGTVMFRDTEPNRWYAAAVQWGVEAGILTGYPDGSFRPDTSITVEQLTAILQRCAAWKGMDTSAAAAQKYPSVSGWAREAFAWADANALLPDSGQTPQASVTRAEAAEVFRAFAHRFP